MIKYSQMRHPDPPEHTKSCSLLSSLIEWTQDMTLREGLGVCALIVFALFAMWLVCAAAYTIHP